MLRYISTAAKTKEAKVWEVPHAYLQMGQHGPYYVLHSFRSTEDLDTKDKKKLKVAGILKSKVRKRNSVKLGAGGNSLSN